MVMSVQQRAMLENRVNAACGRYRAEWQRLRATDPALWLDESARKALKAWRDALTELCDFDRERNDHKRR
jgi:hypothetical protein